jgi:predicted nuclease of restriction endonuclease-like RecB superfamily
MAITRETEAIHAGGRVFFPDFTLSRDGEKRVLVEIVGYYTPEYLASKLRVLCDAGLKRIVVCVDESLACDHTDFRASAVLPYRRRVDAAALIAAAERVIAENDA